MKLVLVSGFLVLGAALAVLVTHLLDARRNAESSSNPDEIAQQLTLVVSELRTLDADVRKLEGRLVEIRTSLEVAPSLGVEQLGASRREVEPPLETGGRPRGQAEWVTVLDQGVARVLLEHALTPFDTGVAVHVRKAGEALRGADAEWMAAYATLNAQRSDQQIGVEEFNERLKQVEAASKQKRTAALEQLAEALDHLDK